MDIFRRKDDYEVFAALLRHTLDVVPLELHAYVFMRNHFHLLVTPRELNALERAMHRLDFQYAQYLNGRYERTGAAFEGRYRSTLVDTEQYWYACMRYVELNPVRAGIAADPRGYPWSSYGRHALGEHDPLITPHPLYWHWPARRKGANAPGRPTAPKHFLRPSSRSCGKRSISEASSAS